MWGARGRRGGIPARACLITNETVVVGLEALLVPEPPLEQEADEISEKCKEGEGFQGLLERTTTNTERRVEGAVVEVVILSREDEGSEPKVREDPGQGGEVSLVGLDQRENEGGHVEDDINGSNCDPVGNMGVRREFGNEVGSYAHDDDRRDPVQPVVQQGRQAEHLARRTLIILVCYSSSGHAGQMVGMQSVGVRG